jgi:histidine ammonia-lyase
LANGVAPARILLDGDSLDIDGVVAVARHGSRVVLAPRALRRMRASRAVVEGLVRRNETAYGITTGFGEFAHIKISREKTRQLQRNLIMSHAVGVGEPFSREIVRAAMLVRANALAKGFSGVQPAVVRLLIEMLNAGVHPVVPSQGSLGASGDLAPLAHLVLPMIGLGHAEYRGKVLRGDEAFRRAKLKPITLEAKDGLGLINGTAFMAGIGALLIHDARTLLEDAQIAAAMTVEALLGTDQAFRPIVGELRPHPGQIAVAKNLWSLTRGSGIVASHKDPGSHAQSPRVQDAYAIRCTPQVLGASMDAIAYAERVVSIELNSATDNPLILPGAGSLSAGNFHGQPLALAFDFLAIALSEVASIAERRVDRLVNPHVSGMKAFLIESGGLNSGYMVAQYTAAALVSENKVLSHPASVDSIPTSANQEDHVSMGLTAATKAVRVLENVANVVAIEYMCAAQGLDFRRPLTPAKASGAARSAVRRVVKRLVRDRVLSPDIEKIRLLMRDGRIRSAVSEQGVRLVRVA